MFNMVLHDDLSDQSLQILHPEFLKKIYILMSLIGAVREVRDIKKA